MAKANIYFDEQGRRRVDRSKPLQGPPAPDPEIAALKAAVATLTAKVEKIDNDLQCFELIGDNGIDCDGNGPTGIVVRGPATAGGGAAASGQQWYELTLCDDTVLKVWAKDVVEP